MERRNEIEKILELLWSVVVEKAPTRTNIYRLVVI